MKFISLFFASFLFPIFCHAEITPGKYALLLLMHAEGAGDEATRTVEFPGEVTKKNDKLVFAVNPGALPLGADKEKQPAPKFSIKVTGDKVRLLISDRSAGGFPVALLEGTISKDTKLTASGVVSMFKGSKERKVGSWKLFTEAQAKTAAEAKEKNIAGEPLADPADVPEGFEPFNLTVSQAKKLNGWFAKNKQADPSRLAPFLESILNEKQRAILKKMANQ